MKTFVNLVCLLLVIFTGNAVQASPLEEVKALKERLIQRGITIEMSEKADYVSVYKGGLINKDTFVGLAEIRITLDTERAGLWKGGEFYVHGTNVHGHLKPTGEMVGDLQAVNNDEGPRTTRLYEAWYQHHFLDDKVAVLAGIHDLNTDFMVSEYAGLYINGAFGVPTSLTANVPSSVYPLAAPAARIKIKIVDKIEILAGVYDGDPGDPDINEHSTRLALKKQDGLFSIAEAAWHYQWPGSMQLPGSIKLGA